MPSHVMKAGFVEASEINDKKKISRSTMPPIAIPFVYVTIL